MHFRNLQGQIIRHTSGPNVGKVMNDPIACCCGECIASFEWSGQSGGVQFTDTSPDAVSWFWEFGDGGTSNQQNPFHVYGCGNQSNTVRLTITTSTGAQCSKQHFVYLRCSATPVPYNNALVTITNSGVYPNSVNCDEWCQAAQGSFVLPRITQPGTQALVRYRYDFPAPINQLSCRQPPSFDFVPLSIVELILNCPSTVEVRLGHYFAPNFFGGAIWTSNQMLCIPTQGSVPHQGQSYCLFGDTASYVLYN